jgi:hypothetical protein
MKQQKYFAGQNQQQEMIKLIFGTTAITYTNLRLPHRRNLDIESLNRRADTRKITLFCPLLQL